MKRFLALSVLFGLTGLPLIGCGGGNGSTSFTTNPQGSGAVYVTGEDAPLSSVVSLNLTINSITLSGAHNSPQLIASPITVDFARLVGLRTQLAFKAVPADTYSSATFVLASPVIDVVSAANPPAVTSLAGIFNVPSSTTPQTASVTVTFPTPMVVGSSGLAGLHTEFDIPKSLAVDGTGQVTGLISPVIFIQAVQPTDPTGQITELTGTIASVNTAANSFVLQGPFGQFTVSVNGSTTFNSGFTLTNLPASGGFVSLQGAVQPDGSILASDVELITTDQSFVAGRILAINPATGPAQTLTLWVDETGGSTSSLLDTVQTFNVGAVNTYDVNFFNNTWFSPNNMFGNSSMLVGQRIFIGGTFTSPTFTSDLISLRRQGVYGSVVPGSVSVTSANAGNFQELNTGLLGLSLSAPLTVNTGSGTLFFQDNSSTFSLTNLQTDTATSSVPAVARGLVLMDTVSGNPVLWSQFVREVQH